MLCLYLQAPFGAFRAFAAGSFRPTAGFVTFSAAYGLILNVAGIEMRKYDDKKVMTLIGEGLPRFRLAMGALAVPGTHSLYQQLHNYPVGATGKEHAPRTKGSKYNIAPVRRAFLSDIRAYLCMDGDPALEGRVEDGLSGKAQRAYGLPFLGDNNFLPDRLERVVERSPARWFVPLDDPGGQGPPEGVTRLTISIDRADMSRTRSALFAPTREELADIPEKAWVEVGY